MTSNNTQSGRRTRAYRSVGSRGQTSLRVRRLLFALRVVVAAGLIIDSWIHFDLASNYDVVKASVSQGTLFRLEAVVAAVAALLVIGLHRRIVLIVAMVVAASAVAVLLINTYTNPGQLGPLPDMYEPTWFAEKTVAVVAEGVAAIAALAAIILESAPLRRHRG